MKDNNLILESLFNFYNLDITNHHKQGEDTEQPRKKQKKIDDYVEEESDNHADADESEYLNSSLFSAQDESSHEDARDTNIDENNHETPPVELEPSPYDLVREARVKEIQDALLAAEEAGEF